MCYPVQWWNKIIWNSGLLIGRLFWETLYLSCTTDRATILEQSVSHPYSMISPHYWLVVCTVCFVRVFCCPCTVCAVHLCTGDSKPTVPRLLPARSKRPLPTYFSVRKYRVFIKYCFFTSNVVIFLNSASSAAALVFYLPGVCTHTDTEGKQRKARVRNI